MPGPSRMPISMAMMQVGGGQPSSMMMAGTQQQPSIAPPSLLPTPYPTSQPHTTTSAVRP